MNLKNFKAPFKALVIVAVCAISLWAVIPVQKTIRLGLDLQGGARLLLQLYPTEEVPQITSQVQAQTREVIDRRINGLGVAEPSISNVGTDRILVELPAVKDPQPSSTFQKRPMTRAAPSSTPARTSRRRKPATIKAAGRTSSFKPKTPLDSASSRRPISRSRWASFWITAISRRRSFKARFTIVARSPAPSLRKRR